MSVNLFLVGGDELMKLLLCYSSKDDSEELFIAVIYLKLYILDDRIHKRTEK